MYEEYYGFTERPFSLTPAHPQYARARNNLGVTYLNQRKLDAAASELHAALGIDPQNVESMVNLSTVEKEAGRLDGAERPHSRAGD